MKKEISNTGYRIKEVSAITGVKTGTIRFYEKCGFLEPVERLPNNYRIFTEHHIYQIRICRLVFGGFVNKRLRKISMDVIAAASCWNLQAYDEATRSYKQAVEEDVDRTKQAICIVMKRMGEDKAKTISRKQYVDKLYSKKEAAGMLGVTPEAIRNWERNGLLHQAQPYQKRFYGQSDINRMYVIRFLLDIGYSIMVILSFLTEYDKGEEEKAVKLILGMEENEDLKYRADKYLNALLQVREKATVLCELLEEMRKT